MSQDKKKKQAHPKHIHTRTNPSTAEKHRAAKSKSPTTTSVSTHSRGRIKIVQYLVNLDWDPLNGAHRAVPDTAPIRHSPGLTYHRSKLERRRARSGPETATIHTPKLTPGAQDTSSTKIQKHIPTKQQTIPRGKPMSSQLTSHLQTGRGQQHTTPGHSTEPKADFPSLQPASGGRTGGGQSGHSPKDRCRSRERISSSLRSTSCYHTGRGQPSHFPGDQRQSPEVVCPSSRSTPGHQTGRGQSELRP